MVLENNYIGFDVWIVESLLGKLLAISFKEITIVCEVEDNKVISGKQNIQIVCKNKMKRYYCLPRLEESPVCRIYLVQCILGRRLRL